MDMCVYTYSLHLSLPPHPTEIDPLHLMMVHTRLHLDTRGGVGTLCSIPNEGTDTVNMCSYLLEWHTFTNMNGLSVRPVTTTLPPSQNSS
jgi:hypothetical protein